MSNDPSAESPSSFSDSGWMTSSSSPPQALFIGLITLDLLYLAKQPLQPNEKQVAQDYQLCPGGPATNAAITFAYLAHHASIRPEVAASEVVAYITNSSRVLPSQTDVILPSRSKPDRIPEHKITQREKLPYGRLIASLGQHPLAQIVESEIQRWGIEVMDITPKRQEPPSLSSIVVSGTSISGTVEEENQRSNRAIISINALHHQAAAPSKQELLHLLGQGRHQTDSPSLPIPRNSPKVLLIDGHQMSLSSEIAPLAQSCGIPVVVDGGSWKPGFEKVLTATDYALCSANFRPPGCDSEAATVAYLQTLNIPYIAITHGGEPIHYWQHQKPSPATEAGDCNQTYNCGTIPVPTIHPLDTLGAGDIFHGAFCYSILDGDFVSALEEAAAVASYACKFFGPRSWQQTTESQL